MRAVVRRLSAVLVLAAGVVAAGAGVQAQTPARMPLVAILEPGSASTYARGVAQFKQALGELGWVEGRTVRIEMRYCEWRSDLLAAMARELVGLKPDVIYTHWNESVLAAARATTSIPIVVGAAADLLATGTVRSLAQPGGNVTGVTHAQPELDRKRLEVLKEVVPSFSRFSFLYSAGSVSDSALKGLDDSARRLGVRLQHAAVSEPGQIEAAFATMVKDGTQALLVQDGPLLARHRERVTTLAIRHRLPSVSQIPLFAETGGLLQYGADVLEMFRRSAAHVDKILRGAKPGDLPIEQPTKVDLIVNLKTAKALGITIPRPMLIRADRVIE